MQDPDPNRSETAPPAPGPTDTPTPGAYDRPEASTGVPAQSSALTFSAGDVVTFTYKDAADNDVVRFGTVVEVVENHNAATDEQTRQGVAEALPGARVAWLGDVSDPIPFDQLERHGDSR